MKRETKKASKEITLVCTTLRRLGAASGERIAAGTGLATATVGQVLWTLSEAGIIGYSKSSELWYAPAGRASNFAKLASSTSTLPAGNSPPKSAPPQKKSKNDEARN